MNKLNKLYYDPEHGFLGQTKLYKKAQENNINVTQKQVAEFIKAQPAAQKLSKAARINSTNMPIQGPIGSYQIDIAFIPTYKASNNGYQALLTAVGINNRYGHAIPLKNKNTTSIITAMKQLISDIRAQGPLVSFESDNGSEFISRAVKNLLKEENIEQELVATENHNQLGLIERFNRTLKGILSSYFIANDTTRWIDILPKILKNYNSTSHGTIGIAPAQASEKEVFLKNIASTEYIEPKIAVGNTVRKAVKRGKFAKEGQIWSDQTFVVSKVNTKTVVLDNEDRVKISDVLVIPSTTNTRVTRERARKVVEKKSVEDNYVAKRRFNKAFT